MKNSIMLVAAITFIGMNLNAQKNVPLTVKTAFSEKFMNATDVKWGKENKTEWEAEFKMDGKSYSANFDQNGSWVETEYKITTAEIPAEIMTVIEKKYITSKIKSAEISETSKGKVFEVTLTKANKNIEVVFDEKGNLIKK